FLGYLGRIVRYPTSEGVLRGVQTNLSESAYNGIEMIIFSDNKHFLPEILNSCASEHGYVTNDEVFKEIFEQAENFKKCND
ncbi:MAG: hypothetical protein Q4D56_13485, partial [Bacteroides sp.]|nr:hypothetical protein [Bacteroides sp.]